MQMLLLKETVNLHLILCLLLVLKCLVLLSDLLMTSNTGVSKVYLKLYEIKNLGIVEC